MKKIKELYNKYIFSMNYWRFNKKRHNEYWGKLFISLKQYYKDNNKSSLDDTLIFLQNEEFNNKEFEYILYDEKKFGTDVDYLTDKKHALKKLFSKHITEKTEVIYDLGSGWGRNSIILSSMFPNQKIITGELSTSGREITQFFIDKYDLNIEVLEQGFNWKKYSNFLKNIKLSPEKDIIIFTSHSIEQIKKIDNGFFNKLLTYNFNNLTFLHIEPVNWQIENTPFPWKKPVYYNRDFVSLIYSLAESKKIQILNITPRYWSPNLSTTSKNSVLIEFKKLV